MADGRLVVIVRCSQCRYALPTGGPDDEENCSRYRRKCPPNGIPVWCRLRRVKVRKLK